MGEGGETGPGSQSQLMCLRTFDSTDWKDLFWTLTKWHHRVVMALKMMDTLYSK